jgi:hypothetical protein
MIPQYIQAPTIWDTYGKVSGMQSDNALKDAQRASLEAQTPEDPYEQANRYLKLLATEDKNSPQYEMANRDLMGLVNSSGTPGALGFGSRGRSAGGSGGGSGGAGLSIGAQALNSPNINPTTVSSRSLKGGQSIFPNEDGTNTVTESPTTSTQSNVEKRAIANAESVVFQPIIERGLPYYYSPTGGLKLSEDILKYNSKNTPPEEKQQIGQRLQDFSAARRIMTEQVLNNLIQANASNIGVETVHGMVQQMFPGLPGDVLTKMLPSDIQMAGMKTANAAFGDAQKAAQKMVAQNFPINIGTDVPLWHSPGFNGPQAPQDWTTHVEQRNAQQLQQYTLGKGSGSQKSAASLGGGQAKEVATTPAETRKSVPEAKNMAVNIPSFKTKEDFNSWYASQPQDVKAQVREKISKQSGRK